MLEVSQDTHSLSSSKRDTLQLLRQLKESGEPVVITINGKAEFIVQDATSYQQLMDLVERLDAIEAIREGLNDAEEGRVVSLDEAMEAAPPPILAILHSARQRLGAEQLRRAAEGGTAEGAGDNN